MPAYNRLIPAFLFLQCLSSVALADPAVERVEPSLIRYGHAGDVRIDISGWQEGTQVAVAPGGAYVMGEWPLAAKGRAVAMDADTAWVSGDGGLSAFGKKGVGETYAANAGAMAMAGGYAYVAEGNALNVVDVKGAKPVRRGSLVLPGPVDDVAVSGTRACLVSGKVVWLVDISHVKRPRSVAHYDLSAAATAVAMDAGRCVAVGPALGVTALAIEARRLRRLDEYHSDDVTGDVAMEGGRIFLADGDTGLTILDLDAHGRLGWQGSYNKLGHVVAVAAEGERVLVADDKGVLNLFDVRRPHTPILVAGYRLKDAVRAVSFAHGKAAVVTDRSLAFVDLSAETPPPLSTIGVNLGGSRRSFIADDILYVADWFSGLHLYDISQPYLPRLISTFHTPGSSKGVLVRDKVAFVGDDDHGLQVVDVHDPRRPQHIADLPLSGLAYTMKLVGNTLYLASHRGGFHIIDVSDVTAPRRIGGFDTPGKSWALEVLGKYAFVADDNSGLLVFDVSRPAAPQQVAAFSPGGQAEDVVIRDGVAFVAFFDQGLYILDIHDPLHPRQIGHLATPGNARGIELRGNLAFIADWFSGIQVLDITDLAHPRLIGHYDTSGAAWGVQLQGDFAYVLDWWGGLKVLDVSVPQRPRAVGRYHGRAAVEDVAVKGNYAFAASGSAGLQVYDIKNALNPVWAAGVDLNGQAERVALADDLALVAAGDAGLAIADIGDPFAAHWIGGLATGIRAERIRAGGGYAYIAEQRGPLVVAQVTDPTRPHKVAAYAATINDLWLADDQLILATPDEGLVVLGVKNPSQPTLKTRRPMSQEPLLLRGSGHTLFVYERHAGVRVMTMPTLQEVAFFPLQEAVADMHVENGKLYLSAEHSGLMVVDVADPSRPRLEAIYATTDRIGDIAVRGEAVFVGGEALLGSARLLPPVAISDGPAGVVTAAIPAHMPMGSYNVVLKTPQGRQAVYHNAFKVGFPSAAKPKFTMDDLRKVLKQKQFEGKAPAAGAPDTSSQ